MLSSPARPLTLAALAVAVAACGLVVPATAGDAEAMPAGGARADASARDTGSPARPDGNAADGAGFLDAALPPFDASGLPTCVSCLALACADLFAQCEQASSCYSAYQCTLAGSDPESCACDAPLTIVEPFFALLRCVSTFACPGASCSGLCSFDATSDAGLLLPLTCGAETPLGCEGDASAARARSSTAACEACVAQACPEFSVACGDESDCQGYLTCLATCQGSGCVDDCGAAHPPGQGAAAALDVCVGGSCASECGY